MRPKRQSRSRNRRNQFWLTQMQRQLWRKQVFTKRMPWWRCRGQVWSNRLLQLMLQEDSSWLLTILWSRWRSYSLLWITFKMRLKSPASCEQRELFSSRLDREVLAKRQLKPLPPRRRHWQPRNQEKATFLRWTTSWTISKLTSSLLIKCSTWFRTSKVGTTRAHLRISSTRSTFNKCCKTKRWVTFEDWNRKLTDYFKWYVSNFS